MKKQILLAVCLLAGTHLFSQDFDVPAAYQFTTKEDYTTYEKDIIAAAKWLQATPLNEQEEKRKSVSAFMIKWINGSPTVNVELNETVLKMDQKNRGMMVLFMAGCARYVLENNYSKDMRAKHKAALQAMMEVYKGGKGIKKDKVMEKLIKSDADGKMDEWLEKNLKVGDH